MADTSEGVLVNCDSEKSQVNPRANGLDACFKMIPVKRDIGETQTLVNGALEVHLIKKESKENGEVSQYYLFALPAGKL